MAALPTVGQDDGTWGDILNEYLLVEHGAAGTHSKALAGQLIMKAKVVASGATYSINATTDQIVIINKTVGSGTALTLPASPVAGMVYRIKDGKGDAATNNITITPAAGTIDGGANLIINANYCAVDLVYNGTEWNIV